MRIFLIIYDIYAACPTIPLLGAGLLSSPDILVVVQKNENLVVLLPGGEFAVIASNLLRNISYLPSVPNQNYNEYEKGTNRRREAARIRSFLQFDVVFYVEITL